MHVHGGWVHDQEGLGNREQHVSMSIAPAAKLNSASTVARRPSGAQAAGLMAFAQGMSPRFCHDN